MDHDDMNVAKLTWKLKHIYVLQLHFKKIKNSYIFERIWKVTTLDYFIYLYIQIKNEYR